MEFECKYIEVGNNHLFSYLWVKYALKNEIVLVDFSEVGHLNLFDTSQVVICFDFFKDATANIPYLYNLPGQTQFVRILGEVNFSYIRYFFFEINWPLVEIVKENRKNDFQEKTWNLRLQLGASAFLEASDIKWRLGESANEIDSFEVSSIIFLAMLQPWNFKSIFCKK